MEEEMNKALELLLGKLVSNKVFAKQNLAGRQSVISSTIEGAKELAEARTRRRLQ